MLNSEEELQKMRPKTYEIDHEKGAIHCLRCGADSHHPVDIAEKYCARCGDYHEFPFLSDSRNRAYMTLVLNVKHIFEINPQQHGPQTH